MTRTVKTAASLAGSLWWEVAASLRKVLAVDDIVLDLDWTRYDHLNVRAVSAGECEIGVTMPPFVDWAQHRRGPLADLRDPDLRVIAAVNLPTWLVAAVDRTSGVETLRQLGEAKFPWKPIMPPADQLLRAWGERILELHGLSTDDIRSWGGDDPPPYARGLRHDDPGDGLPARWVSNETESQLAEYTRHQSATGLANGVFMFVNLASPWTTALSVLRDLTFLTLEDEALDTVRREFGAQRVSIPERLFLGVDSDKPTLGWRHQYIYGRADTDPELVRAILRALNRPEFLDNAMGISYTAVRPGLVSDLRLHPAAEAWYE
ncbi:TAXI family TRAP transporter solute-binding subunit [Nocardia aurantia]|uniref:Uncharacterized protein n=1 Tax=Nocardia aurantia TaxID=2585199 RepID=A0A7K0DUK1_9NOCA|nr:hypothetical protein [Nocardia aurantia]MQY29450.1 hypothetical protein [Nocardia aurantia]